MPVVWIASNLFRGIDTAGNEAQKPSSFGSRLIDSEDAVAAYRVKSLTASECVFQHEGRIAPLEPYPKSRELLVPDRLPWAQTIDKPLRDPNPLRVCSYCVSSERKKRRAIRSPRTAAGRA